MLFSLHMFAFSPLWAATETLLRTFPLATILSVSVGNVHASLTFFATLTHFACLLRFGTPISDYMGDSTTVNYSVTTQSAERAFTAVLAFYVCNSITWDVVLGRNYLEFCCSASGAFYKKINLRFTFSFADIHSRSSILVHIV